MDEISHWESVDNVSTVSSFNCPSSRDNLCVSGSNSIINGIFTWSYFNETSGTDIYICKQCTNSVNTDYLYLYGIIDNGKYYWQIGTSTDEKNEHILTKCYTGNNITDMNYIFDIDDCLYADSWENNPNIIISRCPSTTNGLFQESKICISNSYDSSLNGKYIWSYYNPYIDGSIYYNTNQNIYLTPHISNSNIYQYYISDNNMHIYARCNISNHQKQYIFNITHCIGNWELYYNGLWNIDSNMIASPCQDICIKNSYNSLIDSTYTFVYFTRNTNVYKRIDMFGGKNIYLYGWNSTSGENTIYRWIIGNNPNSIKSKEVYSYCYIGKNLGNEYIFSLDQCLQSSSWKTWSGTNTESIAIEDRNMTIVKCNSEIIDKKCIELAANAEIMRTYSLNKSYDNFAIGFDIYDFGYLETNSFQMEYLCDNTNDTILEIFNFDSIFTSNIVYNLEYTLCNDATWIIIKFINKNSSIVYMNNIYLYYDVNDIIFSDEMDDGDSNWIITPGNATAGYDSHSLCPSDGECYRMCTCTTKYVAIEHKIILNHKLKDLNLEWSLNTDGLNNNTAAVQVQIQCDDFLCILKTYENDCNHNKTCDIQSYNLPNECDFTSELNIKFMLSSPSNTIDNVFIDYVNLSHSNPSGNDSMCIAPPFTTTYIQPTHNNNDNTLTITDLIVISVSSVFVLMAILFIIYYVKRKMKIAPYIPLVDIDDITNPLVGIIAIGDYNNDMNPLESDLPNNLCLDDIPVETDVENLQELFKRLNYKVIPNNKKIKINWTEEEIIMFLKNMSDELFDENHKLKYDGLILCISAHGIEDHIITSDYKTINKTAIHRCISLRQVKARDIPRIHIFDSCEGSAERRPSICSGDSDEYEIKKKEKGKYFGAENLENSLMNAWTDENSNPDFKLVEIHAANYGYQAKMNCRVGSYLLHQFAEKVTENINKNKNMTLGNMFDAIQNELHDLGKQQIVKSFNNGTSFLRLKVNKVLNEQEDINDSTDMELATM